MDNIFHLPISHGTLMCRGPVVGNHNLRLWSANTSEAYDGVLMTLKTLNLKTGSDSISSSNLSLVPFAVELCLCYSFFFSGT